MSACAGAEVVFFDGKRNKTSDLGRSGRKAEEEEEDLVEAEWRA